MGCGNMTANKMDYDLDDYNDCLASMCSETFNQIAQDQNAK